MNSFRNSTAILFSRVTFIRIAFIFIWMREYIRLLVNFKALLQYFSKPKGVLGVPLLRTIDTVGCTPSVYILPAIRWASFHIPFYPCTQETNACFLKRDVNILLRESEELYRLADKWYGKCVHEFGLSFLSSGICHDPFNWFILMYHPSSVIAVQYYSMLPYREALWFALVRGTWKLYCNLSH